MYRIMVVFAVLAMVSPAAGELPERAQFDETINLAVGQSETLTFKSSFSTVNVVAQGIALATAQSDRTITFSGESVGSTAVFIYGQNGLIYSARLVVGAEPGQVLKIYGHRDVKDYIGLYCTEKGCGRADKELGGARETGKSVEVTKPNPDGGSTTTRTHGPRSGPP